MCEICNIEKGVTDFLVSEDVAVNIFDDGENTFFNDDSELIVSIHRDTDGYHYLEFEYSCDSVEKRTGDGRIVARIHIDYCPFCGEELKRKPKRFVFKNK